MKGCRPLTRTEVKTILGKVNSIREKALLVVGFATGYRISELLSMRMKDVASKGGEILKYAHVKKTKNGEGRSVLLNSDAQKVLRELVRHLKGLGMCDDTPLFVSRKHDVDGNVKAISRQHAWTLLKQLFEFANIFGNVATHSMRKTYAAFMREALKGDLAKLQAALGHKAITSTISYISFAHEEIDDAITSLAFLT
jgi:site-specific recombinase XerD